MSFSLSKQEEQLKAAILQAGEVLLDYWPGASKSTGQNDLGIQKKSDGSFVTEADFASNRLITEAIASAYPADGIMSEEIPIDDSLKDRQRLWIIDPLDGTQSFIDGNDDFSILVALALNGRADLGLMHFPVRKQFVAAKKGSGAFLNGTRMSVSTSATLRPECVYIRNFKPIRPELTYPRWMDSGCAFLTLANGQFDGLIMKIVSHREWDLAAPAVAVMESGGIVTDESGKEIRFFPGSMTYKYFVASNGRAHDELLKLIPRDNS